MKNRFKKAAAVICAAVMSVSLCGCADTGSIMTVDGLTIRNGVYLYYQQTALSNARNAVSEQEEAEKSDSTADSSEATADTSASTAETTETKEPDLLDKYINGTPVVDWVKDDTMRLVREFVTVQRLCEEKGITLTDEEKNSINSDVKSMWNDSNYYAQYLYGVDTIGEYYESMGIAEESVKQVFTVDSLKTKLFSKFYDKDGETPVTDDELKEFLKENYAAVKTISFTLDEDTDQNDVVIEAEAYAERINNGESLIDVKYDIDLKAKQEEAKPGIEEYYGEGSVEDMTLEEYMEQELAKITVDKIESADDLDTVFSKDGSAFDEDVIDYILGLPEDGKASVYTNEAETAVYIIMREDVTAKTEWIENNRTGILMDMKSDEYDSVLELYGQNYDVDSNSYLVDNKYSPEKLRESE